MPSAHASAKPVASVAWLLLALATPVHPQPSGGEAVTFPSPDGTGDTIWLRGMLWMPRHPPHAAVVLVHGSGGWSDHREGHYARALSGAGYAALAIDAFGARGIRQTIEDQSQISSLQMARDAFAARRFLVERGFAADRMAIMGFSKGGAAALYAADRSFLPEETDRFQAAMPFYPGCNVHPRVPKPAGEVFMAIGELDDYTGVRDCRALAADYAKAGGRITVRIYPGASHGFDGSPAITRTTQLPTAENFSDCIIRLDEDGQVSYAGRRYGWGDRSLAEDLRRTCMRKGASIATSLEQKRHATRDTIGFLDSVFAR